MTGRTSRGAVVEGDGLILRPWRRDDIPALLRAFGDPAIRHYAAAIVDTQAQAEEFVRRRLAAWDDGSGLSWAVAPDDRDRDPSTDSGTARAGILGHVGIHATYADLGQAMVGYWLVPRARGRGVATHALRLGTAYAFAHRPLHRIELAHAVENEASCRVAERAGYAYEGAMRDAMRYPVDGRWSTEHLHARLRTDD